MSSDNEVTGLKYSPGYLQSLPILLSRPAPFAPIRALTVAQFAELQKQYSLADDDQIGDSVLFPFLHGIEGNNIAQNSFFANARTNNGLPVYSHPLLPPINPPVKVPKYRGLVWVRADDEMSTASPPITTLDTGSDFETDSSDSEMYEIESADHAITKSVKIEIPRQRSQSSSTTSSESPLSAIASTAPTSLPPSPSSLICPSNSLGSGHTSLLNSTLRAQDLLINTSDGPHFIPPRVPDGISLRNFGIQVAVYATLSDVVIYAPRGLTRSAFALAERFKHAIEAKAIERERTSKSEIVHYNVFIVTEPFSEFEANFPHLVSWNSNGLPGNFVDFAAREREEMCNLTQATEVADGIWLGNMNDLPNCPDTVMGEDPFENSSQTNPYGFDICIECSETAHFPSISELSLAEEHIRKLEELWASRHEGAAAEGLPRPAPSANQVLHLAFPSSPIPNNLSLNHIAAFISFLHRLLYPSPTPSATPTTSKRFFSHSRKNKALLFSSDGYTESSVLALCLLMTPKPSHYAPPQASALSVFGTSATASPNPSSLTARPQLQRSTSNLTVTFSGGSSIHGMSLPEAYLELQIARGRSFYVYPSDLDLLKRAEARLYHGSRDKPKERGRDREVVARTVSVDGAMEDVETNAQNSSGSFGKWKWTAWGSRASFSIHSPPVDENSALNTSPLSISTPSASLMTNANNTLPRRRARASTSPMPQVLADHWAWFSDPRFDGSFPSRVLPFLYLGNLAHASNAYMLHALGITHVVSVGECALVPPQSSNSQAAEYRFSYAGKVLGAGPGSLWIEEREGRIKVLDIKGVSDDGIDSLRPRLREVCDWIDDARQQGGKVLIHCRVGVSRSATVTIAYVMKHLGVPLVDAYLLVRSRRLSVLIQPNLRLLYNLCSWEVEIAREKAKEEGESAYNAFMRKRLSWPYLSREVHLLNEKYIQ